MSEAPNATERIYELFTYDDDWDRVKKILNLTDEELRDEVESILQISAWSDILREVLYLADIDPDDVQSSDKTGTKEDA